MNILACDTSTQVMRISLCGDDGRFTSKMIDIDGMHTEYLIPEIQGLLSTLGLSMKELNLLACTQGPGSFTGLRISMSTLKGISLALHLPLLSIPTMEVLAHAVGFFPGAIVPVIDARKKRFYSAIFAEGERKCPDLDCDGDEVGRLLEGYPMALLTGPDALAFASHVKGYTGKLVVDENRFRDIGFSLSRLAQKKFQEKGADDIGVGPTYVRHSDAEVALQAKIERLAQEAK